MDVDGFSQFENDSLTCHGKTSLFENAVPDESAALALKNVFFFLGLIFRYPDEIVYNEINRHMKPFAGFFTEYGEGVPPLPPISELQAEYVSLFVNNKGFVPALPYASSHIDQGLLMGKSYFKIKQVLENSGFRLDAAAGELEDHISVLLESCSDLVFSIIENKSNARKIQTIALTLHEITSCIKMWIDKFAESIRAYAAMDFYKISGEALRNFMENTDQIYHQVLGLDQNSQAITEVNRWG